MSVPAEFFARWTSDQIEPLHIEDDGRVWGHVTSQNECMRGPNECRLLPDASLAGFHVGSPIELDDGTTVRPGPMTLAGLHLDRNLTYAQARRARHEDTSRVVAQVVAWPTHHGIAVSGRLIPGLSETVIEQARTAGWSVELWPNPQTNQRELIAVHSVPTPASPIAASADCGCDGSCTSTDERTDLMVVADALSLLTEKVGTLENLLGTREVDSQVELEPESQPEPVEDVAEEPAPFAALAQYLQSKNAGSGDD